MCVIGALIKVNTCKCEFTVYTVTIFMECITPLRGSNNFLTLYLMVKIVVPRPDMNIKVAAFTVAHQLNYTVRRIK